MAIFGASINTSPVITRPAGEKFEDGSYYPVKLDANGNFVKCSASGEAAVGILIAQTVPTAEIGEDLTAQIKDMGPAVAGAAIAAGKPVMVNAAGKLVEAVPGAQVVHVLGYAMEAASMDGDIIQIQIMKSVLSATA